MILSVSCSKYSKNLSHIYWTEIKWNKELSDFKCVKTKSFKIKIPCAAVAR